MQATPLTDATAGALGAVLANTIVFPLDVVKTRLQVQNKALKAQAYKTTGDALWKIFKKEGVAGLYAGLGSGLAGTVISSFSYFYIYSTLRGAYQSRIGAKSISTAMELSLGAGAGALCQFVTLPIQIVTTRQQTDPSRPTVLETLRTLLKEEGVTELWKGLQVPRLVFTARFDIRADAVQASLVLCSNPAITYGMFERVKALWIKHLQVKQLTSGQIFLVGALSKTLATIVTCTPGELMVDPYIMAKVRMQWKAPKGQTKGLTEKEKQAISYKSAWDILAKIYKAEGLIGWYNVR
ncbi:ADP/ATP carrier protein [Kappamyces sp. JEL0829]|nr:ADP/ATP carrier protein [Kappamyces sp. JEL0829]